LPLAWESGSDGASEPCGKARPASSLVRSGERRDLEEVAVATAVAGQIDHFRRRNQWERLKCVELLFVRGWTNKETAAALGISEKTAAGYKFDFLTQIRKAIRSQGLPESVFPELYP
jgi:RNA polymerase sigma-70 factor (ECF subfamily)